MEQALALFGVEVVCMVARAAALGKLVVAMEFHIVLVLFRLQWLPYEPQVHE